MYSPDAAELRAAREQLVSYSARLLDDGLAVGSAGNLSLRCGDLIAITPSGISYTEMCPGDDELPAIHYSITSLGGPVRVAPYVRFGSDGLATAATEALAGRRAAILRNHGAISYGRSLRQAYENALLLEWLAHVYRLTQPYGEPRILSEAELAEVAAEARRRGYGSRRRSQAGGTQAEER